MPRPSRAPTPAIPCGHARIEETKRVRDRTVAPGRARARDHHVAPRRPTRAASAAPTRGCATAHRAPRSVVLTQPVHAVPGLQAEALARGGATSRRRRLPGPV